MEILRLFKFPQYDNFSEFFSLLIQNTNSLDVARLVFCEYYVENSCCDLKISVEFSFCELKLYKIDNIVLKIPNYAIAISGNKW